MANGNRWSMSYGRRFLAFGLMAVGLFVACFGVGLGNAGVLAIGLAVGVLGPAVLLLTAVRSTTKQYIFGTAHVYSASPPPSAGMVGRAEMHLAVFADGIDGVAVRVLDPAVPVSKWPDDGATLPIEVVANNPRKVRVLWDQVVTHAQAAGEDLYPQYVDSLPDDLDDDYDDLPPDDFLDDRDLPPLPPTPPPRMPSGPTATIEAAGMDFAPVSAPILIPPAATPPPGAPPTKVVAESAPTPVAVVAPPPRPVSPAPYRDAGSDLEDRPADHDEYLDEVEPVRSEPAANGSPDLADEPVSPAAPAGPASAGAAAAAASAPPAADGPPLSLPLPRRRPSPHLRRPSPRLRKGGEERSASGPRGSEGDGVRPGIRPGGINPVFLEEAPPEPPPEWPPNPAAGAPAPVRPESRPEPDYTEVVSGTVEAGPGRARGEALSGSIVDDHAYSDRSETDRMTFDRSSFRTIDVDPGVNGYATRAEPATPTEPAVPTEPAERAEPEDSEPAEPDEPEPRGDPFNVIPLRIKQRPAEPVADEPAPDDEPAADDSDDERDGDAPSAGEAFSTEPASFLTAPSAGLSQLGSGGFSVTLFVRELSRSIAFYRDVLGLAEVDTGKNSAVLARGESRILLKRVNDLQPVDRRIVHLNLEVPDVQAAYEELKTKGVEFVHKPRVVSQGEQLELWAATFRDPDGHAIALTRWELRR